MPGWYSYSPTPGELGPAVIIGQSISGGAATIAAATAPDLITGVIEVAPFTRKQPLDLGPAVPGALHGHRPPFAP